MPADRVLSLVTPREEANLEVVAILEELLQRAKTGEVIALSYASILKNGDSLTQCSQSGHFQALLGAMRILEHRMLNESRNPVTE